MRKRWKEGSGLEQGMRKRWKQGLGLEHGVLQAGMGGGLATSELAAAVSEAGGLGTLGMMPPARFAGELQHLRARCGQRPFAANLLMPFVRRAHVQACLEFRPRVVTLFFGFDGELVRELKDAGIFVLHQIGSVRQAVRAVRERADGLIVQGSEAGGHLAGHEPLQVLLPALRQRYPERLLLAAGGIHDAASAAAAMQLGADGVVAGTRFLLTPESHAHPEYLRRLLAADATVRTRLFGLAWPADHRVVPNAATARWCAARAAGPRWVTALNSVTAPTRRLIPMTAVTRLVARQSVSVPFYAPAALTRDMDARQLDTTPLYAGECVRQISELRPAAQVVAEIAAGLQ